MKGKIALLVGGAVGYVLGTRAGRQRYEQIKGQAQKVWQNPTVQQKASQAQDFAKEKAPEARHKVAEAAASATAAAKEKVHRSDDSAGGSPQSSDPADPSSPAYETTVSSPIR